MTRSATDVAPAPPVTSRRAPGPNQSPANAVPTQRAGAAAATAEEPGRAELLRRHEDYLRAVGLGTSSKEHRRSAVRNVLAALEAAEGHTWQARWLASGAEADPARWLGRAKRYQGSQERLGARFLLASRLVQPSYAWFFGVGRTSGLARELRCWTDGDDYARFHEQAVRMHVSPRMEWIAAELLARVLVHTGKRMHELDNDDLLEYQDACREANRTTAGLMTAHQLLRGIGVPGVSDGPAFSVGVRRRRGQVTIEELVDRYEVKCHPVRDLLVRYLRERSAALDYATLLILAHRLVKVFWCDLEQHHPGIDSLRLDPEVAEGWKQRARWRLDGKRPRRDWRTLFLVVRAFYLDIAQWAVTDPATWAAWAAPPPISPEDIKGYKKYRRQRRAEIHNRIRAATPQLPALVRANEQRLRHAEALVAAIRQIPIGAEAVVDGLRYRRVEPVMAAKRRAKLGSDRSLIALDLDGEGRRISVLREEDDAFWSWAAIEVLRLTGVRNEELLELTQGSIRQYRQPDGQLVLLLQIAPSKSDQERVIPVTPELAHVLARIVTRNKDEHGHVPLLVRYDPGERTLSAPLPYLFQRRRSGGPMLISSAGLRDLVQRAVERAGLFDHDDSRLRLTPHDYRRIFATDAVSGGLPIHIAAKILGHLDLNTTRGYTAVFPDDVIQHMQAFMARRRAQRPAEEYRDPTAAEWAEFEAHFGKRTMELGYCRRPYGTPCIHEHACIRCPMLEVAPTMKPRLLEIQTNTRARLDLAKTQGWFGEVEALELNLVHIAEKLTQVERTEAGQPHVEQELLGTLT